MKNADIFHFYHSTKIDVATTNFMHICQFKYANEGKRALQNVNEWTVSWGTSFNVG